MCSLSQNIQDQLTSINFLQLIISKEGKSLQIDLVDAILVLYSKQGVNMV
jgi:hypothetical protein